jgi:hypothetical protein
VWKEITPTDQDTYMEDCPALDEDGAVVELDTVELERLFRKAQGGRQHMAGQPEPLSDVPKFRKQNLVTLLEFNRANNIGKN